MTVRNIAGLWKLPWWPAQLPSVRETTKHTLSKPKNHEEASRNVEARGAPEVHAGAPAEVQMSSGNGASNISISSLAFFPGPVLPRISLPSRLQVVPRCLNVSCGDDVPQNIQLSRIVILLDAACTIHTFT